MYVCIRACVYVCVYVCMYMCVYVCMYVCVRVCVYVCVYVCMYFFCNDLFRHVPLQECNTTCFIVHFGNFFSIGNAVTWTVSGFPLHLHLQYFEHLKTGGVQFVKSL